MKGTRRTFHGELHGVRKVSNGSYVMSVRTDDGKWIEVAHDGVIMPPTMNTKGKRK